jgi:hypothetical protein
VSLVVSVVAIVTCCAMAVGVARAQNNAAHVDQFVFARCFTLR